MIDAIITDGVMTSGSILLPDGTTTVVIATSTPLTDLVNYAPIALFNTLMTNLVATITDTSSDPNNTAPSNLWRDSWNYVWDFGDGATTTASVTTLGNNQTHTYAAANNYVISLLLTDKYGLTSSANANVTAISTPIISGGGGGGGGVGVFGGSYYLGSAPIYINGDINRDGKVDLLDFNILLVDWGKTGNNLMADLDHNGVVDIYDFNQLMVYWQKK